MSVQDDSLWVRAYEIYQNDPDYDSDPYHDPSYHMLFSLAKIQAPMDQLCIGYKSMKKCESIGDLLEQGVYTENMTLVDLYILAFKQGLIDVNYAVTCGIGRALEVYTGDYSLPWGTAKISFWISVIHYLQEKLPIRVAIKDRLYHETDFNKMLTTLQVEKFFAFDKDTWVAHWDEIWTSPGMSVCFEFEIFPVNKFV